MIIVPKSSKKHDRKSIRLKGYDYSQGGFYFITINTYHNQYLFGKIKNGIMILNASGEMINTMFLEIENEFEGVLITESIVMPNHVHFIVKIESSDNKVSLGDVIQVFKRYSTIRYIKNVKENNWDKFVDKVWHRNYYEHIIRNDKDYKRIAKYIRENPKNWIVGADSISARDKE